MDEMAERPWKIGEDLLIEDNILDSFSFYDIALALNCNYSVIDGVAAEIVFEEILEQRLEDARYLLKNNMDEIIDYAERMKGH